ncbi:MAG: hypothetical protein ACLFN2_03430 [Bacteroidales bacterium]
MNIHFLFDYPSWLILVCVLTGLIYAALLYYRNRRIPFSPLITRTLALIRFVTVTLLALLLLAPFVERTTRDVEDPIVVFLQDNSSSLLFAEDSAFYYNDYIPDLEGFLEVMSEGHQPALYSFGEDFREAGMIDFSGRVTNMSNAFRELEARYSNRNIGAVIIAGDGLYNRGFNPLYAAANLPYPVYTMALGDTLPRRDVILKGVNHNEVTYLGNEFPVEVEVEALESEGRSTRLTISRDGEEVYSESIRFTSDHHTETIDLHLEADQTGMQQYEVSLSSFDSEVSMGNNRQSFFIDVIDGRRQVLILAAAPHPDAGAIMESLTRTDHYEAEVIMAGDFDGSAEAYDLVIMHQLPSSGHPATTILELFSEAETPILFIIGARTDLEAFNRLGHGLKIHPRSEDVSESHPVFNRSFSLFSVRETSIRLFNQLPPLHTPFAEYQVPSVSEVMLYQRIGQVETEQPLLMFSESGERRFGVVTGEGIWRWPLHAFMRHGNHRAFDEMLTSMVQYLAVQEDRSLFRVDAPTLVHENESVVFDAELYNPTYELVNEPEIQLVITNEEEMSFPYTMGRTSNAYSLDAGTFEPGSYSWEARASHGGETFIEEGVFSVSALNLEDLRTVADHNVLHDIAESTGGEMYYPGEWDEMSAHIRARDDITPRMFSQKDFTEVIDLKWLFLVLLLLLSIEWVVRKRSGSY